MKHKTNDYEQNLIENGESEHEETASKTQQTGELSIEEQLELFAEILIDQTLNAINEKEV